ncbi:protein kinase domain-containing protein [Aeromicrobium sp.]|uniref:protein kinase domain-containing protein n=1 Tax=Aeromicrobium sp. TaxID=1871063 RepID=UPI003C40ADE4
MPTTLIGRYRLDSLIGGGGMGEVWRSHDEVLSRTVAVKVIRPHLAEDADVRARLRVEAQLAGSLHHPGIVDVYDYGEDERDGRPVPFLVMRLIEGAPLSKLLAERGTISSGETMAIVSEVAAALRAAHEAGIVHRDLKPGNILITPDDRVMLVDFGIAHSSGGEPLTQTGALIGTSDYLSPEQAAGRSATSASDLYSLGVVAHTCLTGTAPFHRDSDIATALAHLQDDPPPLPDSTPHDAASLVLALLAKDPDNRPPSAGAVADAAAALATSVPRPPAPSSSVGPSSNPSSTGNDSSSTPGNVTSVMPATGSGGTASGTAAVVATKDSRFSRRSVLLSSALVVLVAAALGWLMIRDNSILVPDLDGTTQTVATAQLRKAGLVVAVRDVNVAGHKAGEVVGQDLAPGEEVDAGSTITIRVATGRVAIPVKELLGASYKSASSRLQKLGLKVARVDSPSSRPTGTITKVAPSSTAETGDTVTLTVAAAIAAPPPPPANTSGPTKRGDPKKDTNKGKGKK